MSFSLNRNRRIKLLQSQRFLNRVRDEDPYMIPIIPSLISINKLGFITIDSQSGRKESGISYLDGLPYLLLYRSYVFGVMTSQLAKLFISRFNYPHLHSIIVPIVNNAEPSVANDIPLTISRKKDGDTIITHMSKVLPKRIASNYLAQAGFDTRYDSKTDLVFIFCWDSKWLRPALHKNGLFTSIIKTLS